jgi:hypothetical protein
VVTFQAAVGKIEDLKLGIKLLEIVTNVTAFGTLMGIGVQQDGLVHINQLNDRIIKDPAEVAKVQQKVMVTVTERDLPLLIPAMRLMCSMWCAYNVVQSPKIEDALLYYRRLEKFSSESFVRSLRELIELALAP